MHPFVVSKQPAFKAVIEHLLHELSSLRTGRANPAIVEDIKVMAYESVMDLKGVASITAQDTKTLVVQPWDKSLLQAIEKAIRDADIGINPAVDGGIVRLNFPMMTEENRKKLVKTMKEWCEESRVALRQVREASREEVMKMEKAGDIGEDEKFKMLDELDEYTKELTRNIDQIAEDKEKEIMTI